MCEESYMPDDMKNALKNLVEKRVGVLDAGSVAIFVKIVISLLL